MTDHDISGHHEDSSEPTTEDGFDTLALRPELLKTIADLGYEEPTPIQRETIPHLLAGRDLLGQAATGTGKTAAFALPVLQMIDTNAILPATAVERQTVLFSATLPSRITALARKYQNDPVRIQIGRGDTQPGTALVRQSAYMVQRAHKPAALGRILDIEAPKATLVFCRTRTEVDQLTETMNGRGYRAEALHGGMDQPQRDRVMGRLRDGTAELLVATDVAARGLDVDTLTHVVNYDVPSATESYVHRIGRVGRPGRQGVAITLAEPREQRLLFNIEKLPKQQI